MPVLPDYSIQGAQAGTSAMSNILNQRAATTRQAMQHYNDMQQLGIRTLAQENPGAAALRAQGLALDMAPQAGGRYNVYGRYGFGPNVFAPTGYHPAARAMQTMNRERYMRGIEGLSPVPQQYMYTRPPVVAPHPNPYANWLQSFIGQPGGR